MKACGFWVDVSFSLGAVASSFFRFIESPAEFLIYILLYFKLAEVEEMVFSIIFPTAFLSVLAAILFSVLEAVPEMELCEKIKLLSKGEDEKPS